MRDLRKNMLASSIKKVNKEKQRGHNMIGTQLQNKHNGRRITITEKIISDAGNIMYGGDTADADLLHFKRYTVLAEHDMEHWFEISAVRVDRKPKYMEEE